MVDDFPDSPNQVREPTGYICPKCRAETCEVYKPYCGSCGSKMPPELRLQTTGLVTYPWEYRSPTKDVEQIAGLLRKVGKTRYWFEDYHRSFRASEILFSETDSGDATHALICVWTERIRLPIGEKSFLGEVGWSGALTLLGDRERGYRLVDDANDVEVCSGSILLYTVHESLRTNW